MLKMSYEVHLIANCFLFMKHNNYFCTKMIMYDTKYLPLCLD